MYICSGYVYILTSTMYMQAHTYLHLCLEVLDAGTGSVVVVQIIITHWAVQSLERLEVIL